MTRALGLITKQTFELDEQNKMTGNSIIHFDAYRDGQKIGSFQLDCMTHKESGRHLIEFRAEPGSKWAALDTE